MFEMLPEAVRQGLADARKKSLRSGGRLCVHDGEKVHRILRLWDNGFSLDAQNAPRMRGRVDVFDGSRHLYQCLIIDSEVSGDERVFEFKWVHAIPDRPPADFVREKDAPIAMLSR